MSGRSESLFGESQIVLTSDQDGEHECVINIGNSEPSSTAPTISVLEVADPQELLTPTEEPLSSKPWSIFRVPWYLSEVDEIVYKPKIVSIGPIHHMEWGLKAMEAQKLRFRDLLFEQISLRNPSVILESAMKEMEERTRNCYSESFDDMNSDAFVQMMVLDGCFIVELLRLYDKSYKGLEVEEPIFASIWMLPDICCDLLMLENQLPMFVLQKLFELTNDTTEATCLEKLALQFFEPLRPGKDKLPDEKLNAIGECQHLLALFHSTFVPSDYRPSPFLEERCNKDGILPRKGRRVRNAESLSYAGVQFRSKFGSLLDIEFENMVLKIPTLFIDYGTCRPVLRNLLAYEQCNRYAAPYFTCLGFFLDSIVETPNDIAVLQAAGIIKQVGGSDEEVMNLLSSLTKELEFNMDDCYITKQVKDINCYFDSSMARIQYVYRRFLTPAKVLSYIFEIHEALLASTNAAINSTSTSSTSKQ